MTPLTAYRPGDMAARAARASAERASHRPKGRSPPPPPTPEPDRYAAPLFRRSREFWERTSAHVDPVDPWPPLTPAEAWLKGWQTFWLNLLGVRS